jgi:PAS domain S-box-containing protein
MAKPTYEELERRIRELQESEMYYRTLLESVNDAVLVHEIGFDGMPGKFIDANRAALMRLGYTHAELRKLTPKDIATENGYKDLSEARANITSNAAAIFETSHLARNGTPIPVESHVSVVDLAGQRVAVSVVRDLSERKLAEDVLRKSEWFYRSTLDGLLSHIAVLDDRGEIILTNKTYRDFGAQNGINPSNVSEGTNYLTICDTSSGEHSDEAKLFAKGIRDVLSGKRRSFELEYPCHSPVEKRWFVGRVTSFLGEGLRRVVVAHENITERKQAEEVLAHQRKTYEQILDHSLAGYWDWDIPTGDEYLSPTFKKMFGYEEHEIENSAESWQKLIFAEDLPGVYEKFNQHIESKGEIPFYNEVRYHHKNGSTVWVICTGKVIEWDDDGKAKRMIGCHIDITKRKQVEDALRESEEKLQALFSAMTEMVVLHELVFDENDMPCNYRILDCNQAFCRITGIKKETAIGKTATQLYKTESPPYLDVYAKVALSSEPIEFFTEYAPMEKHFLVSVVSPRQHFFATITSDITEIKHAEVERGKLQTQLNQAQKMESVGRLAGGVAHDFNNMLGVILGHTELALLQADEKHDLYSDLKEIQKAAKRSADITKQLLAFARKEIISPKKLDLNDTVESMLNMLRRLIGEDIDLVWKPSAHLWPVKMDPSQIDQILANLCINARDAIDGVGKLTIETGRKSFDEEYCKDHPGFIPGDFMLLAVSDNGCGMDKDTLDNLFEPFFTTKDVGKGTGLGLATVYGIVKQNNGFINVYSEPDQGSTFRIYLPRLVGDENIGKAVSEKKAAAGGAETILLVEDEPSIRRMTRMMLERMGYTVLSAATPSEAVEKAKSHSGFIDLLMTDVVMPEMNGRDLSGKITDLYPDTRLLFMSGYTANVIAHQGVLDDGVAFIQKPFSMADLTEKVRELLDMASDKAQCLLSDTGNLKEAFHKGYQCKPKSGNGE